MRSPHDLATYLQDVGAEDCSVYESCNMADFHSKYYTLAEKYGVSRKLKMSRRTKSSRYRHVLGSSNVWNLELRSTDDKFRYLILNCLFDYTSAGDRQRLHNITILMLGKLFFAFLMMNLLRCVSLLIQKSFSA